MKDKYKISVNNLNVFEFSESDLSLLDIRLLMKMNFMS
jgi:hypothetical protein